MAEIFPSLPGSMPEPQSLLQEVKKRISNADAIVLVLVQKVLSKLCIISKYRDEFCCGLIASRDYCFSMLNLPHHTNDGFTDGVIAFLPLMQHAVAFQEIQTTNEPVVDLHLRKKTTFAPLF
jgi:hypothetical protein